MSVTAPPRSLRPCVAGCWTSVRGIFTKVFDYLTAEPVRIRSVLRIALVVLIVLLVSFTHVSHWLDKAFAAVLAAYGIASVCWLVYVMRSPVRWWSGWVATAADVVFVVALCVVSGSATIWLFPIFLLLPISVAFLSSPAATAALGFSSALGYLLAWVFYAMRGGTMEMTESRELGLQDVPAVRYQSPVWGGIPGVVYVQVGCLVWLAVATTALSFTLARRSQRVLDLLDVRRRLVAESVHADERANRELSEQLHDGPLQSLLAARLELDELREHPSGSGFDHLDAALRDIVTALRTTVSTLHPQVLTEVGLSAAVTDLARRYEQRWGVPVSTEIEEMGRVPSQTLLYRAARELLANVTKHARATAVQVVLRRTASATVLIVADDGVGFDPAILSRRVAEGHIGLASLMVTVDAMGGILDISPGSDGGGTVVSVTVPDEVPGTVPDTEAQPEIPARR